MAEARAALKAVDRVEITTLVDNNIDVFLPSTKEIRRAQVPSNLPWGSPGVQVAPLASPTPKK